MRYWKAIYVESEDEKRAVDQLLEALRALSSCVDYDTTWEEDTQPPTVRPVVTSIVWTPVEKKLPDDGVEVLVYRGGNNGRKIFMARQYNGVWMPLAHVNALSPQPTYWTPVPKFFLSEDDEDTDDAGYDPDAPNPKR